MPNGSDIIIRGGSAAVEFDTANFIEEPHPEPSAPRPGNRKNHRNSRLKITRVQITGAISFDSGVYAEGLKCEITAHCEP
ncbi:MAG TPA: hypothetical protein VFH31_14015 [Pyrinomonadaceae bacterium]|nr:hypothetical protein [Pyrinomonadaceae bacterium]